MRIEQCSVVILPLLVTMVILSLLQMTSFDQNYTLKDIQAGYRLTQDDFSRIQEGDPALRYDSPAVLEYARRLILAPSRLPISPYSKRTHYSQVGQSELIDKLLKQKTHGFHIECGATNGEVLSNTLFFEMNRDWEGLLVEANPDFFRNLLWRNRHAYAVNACLSPTNQTQAMKYIFAGIHGGVSERMSAGQKQVSYLVPTQEKQNFPRSSWGNF